MEIPGVQLIAELTDCDPALLDDETTLKQILAAGISSCEMAFVKITSHKFQPIGVTAIAIISESHIAIHTYPEANHASVDIFHCSNDVKPLHRLLGFLKTRLHAKSSRFIEISRGSALDVLEKRSLSMGLQNGFEIKYRIDKLIHSHRSKYHKIDVIENKNFGRMLFLDNDPQLAESDVELYNNALVDPLIEENKIGNVAILGGGDGGVLNTLIQQGAGKVTLVDIDAVVIEMSKKYLQSVCGAAFEHPNVEVIIGDANAFLEQENSFDAIIYDLTCDPQMAGQRNVYDFFGELFSKIHARLNPGGLLTMQCCSKYDTRTYAFVQNLLSDWFTGITLHEVFIPSFCEPWIFGKAVRKV